VEEAGACTELLLRHLLGWSRTELLLNWGDPFPEEKAAEWQQWLVRKATGEPAQYIVGEQPFYGLPFAVGPAVLIPRPETELLVERILQLGAQLWPEPAAPLLADIGTGSGAIPVSIAVHRPAWRVYSSDISAAALEMAQSNAVRNGVGDRVTFLQGDLLQPYIDRGLAVDILVSNPPYIPAGDIPALQREVRLFEPHSALAGGEDGLDLYRRMLQQLPQLPMTPRLIGFEVGHDQADALAGMLKRLDLWERIETVKDLAGFHRHVIAY
jgi:release factor glutamine methyltransferase